MLKTAPGTKIIRYDRGRHAWRRERYITMPRADVRAGYSHTDDYRLSAADYYEHLVDHVPRLAASIPRWSPGAGRRRWRRRSASRRRTRTRYPRGRRGARRPLHRRLRAGPQHPQPAARLRGLHRRRAGVPHRVRRAPPAGSCRPSGYQPGRHDDGLMWGDYAMARIEPGNRVDRFLAGVAYLDGRHPSAVFARGYYTRTTLVAYDWDGRRLPERLVRRQRLDADDQPVQRLARTGATAPTPSSARSPRRASTRSAPPTWTATASRRSSTARPPSTTTAACSTRRSTCCREGSAAPGQRRPARARRRHARHRHRPGPARPGDLHRARGRARSRRTAWRCATRRPARCCSAPTRAGTPAAAMIGDVLPEVRGIESWASLPGGSDALGLLHRDRRR